MSAIKRKNQATKQLALFVRDLLDYDESMMRIGRFNFERDDFSQPLIVIDSIAGARRIGTTAAFDVSDEINTYSALFSAQCTINFYGDDEAFQRAALFSLMIKTEKSTQLQEQLQISVYDASTITDVKALTGQQYGERFEVSLNLNYVESIKVNTLRIEESELNFIFNK